jgi:hypothetical protein
MHVAIECITIVGLLSHFFLFGKNLFNTNIFRFFRNGKYAFDIQERTSERIVEFLKE